MTPREADKIIKAGKPVTVHSEDFNETFTAVFTNRDRRNIYADYGGKFDRADLVIVAKAVTQ